jgi:hypothetical protein
MKKEFEEQGKKFTMEVTKLKEDKKQPYVYYSIKTKGKDYEAEVTVAEKHLMIQIKEEERKARGIGSAKLDINEVLKEKGFK